MPFRFETIYFDNPIVEGRAIDIFVPDNVTQSIGIFFVHGGGWRRGSRTDYHTLMRAFNAEGFICGATDYRLAGVHIAEQVADIREGYDLFQRELDRMGRPTRVFVIGSSAGAHLALLLTVAKPGDCRDSTAWQDSSNLAWIAPIGAAVASAPATFEPWDSIFPGGWTSMTDIVGAPYETNPDAYRIASPIHHVSDDSPAILFLEAGNEHMFGQEVNQPFIDKMHKLSRRAEMIVYEKMEHGFFYSIERRQQKQALADVLEFIKSLDS